MSHVEIPFGQASPKIIVVIKTLFFLIANGFRAFNMFNHQNEIAEATSCKTVKQQMARSLSFNNFLAIIGDTFKVPNMDFFEVVDVSAGTREDMSPGAIRALMVSRKRNVRTWFLQDTMAKSIRLDTSLQHETVKLPIKNGKQVQLNCKNCSKKNYEVRMTWMCSVCHQALCTVPKNGL